jgi:hypothetical protein
MTPRARLPLAGLLMATGSLLLVTTAPAPAYAEIASQAPGKPGKPEKPEKPGDRDKPKKKAEKPRPKPDRRAPAAPAIGGTSAGPGGSISVSVSAESGSRVVVRERGGGVVATGTGSGTYTWYASTGSHSYVVTATDAAGNTSRASQVSATADATPPRLSAVQTAMGDRSDSRSRLTFVTDPGSSYRVLVDGKVVAQRSDPDARVALFLDVANGRHRVVLEVRDPVGNVRTWNGPLRVRIPRLDVAAAVVGKATNAVQRVSIQATPNATRGVVRVPGQGREEFRFFRGRATVRLTLPDGTYERVQVTVRDGRGRTGTRTLRPFAVDTTAPEVTARLDAAAAEKGRLRATVATDPGATIDWRVVDDTGAVVTSGDLVADESGTATVDRDVAEGELSLTVSATDRYDRTTSTSLAATVAPDPWSYARTGLLVGGPVAGGLLLVVLLVPAVPFLARRAVRARARLTARRIDRAALARARDQLATFEGFEELDELELEALEEELADTTANPAVLPAQRSRHHAVETLLQVANHGGGDGSIFPLGLDLMPDERILHTTPGQLYETGEDADELVLVGHEGEVVVTNRRLVFVGDVTRDWWTGLIEEVDHVGEDRTVLRRWREDSWSGVVYDDAEVTRLYLDMLVAEQQGTRTAYLSRLEEELRGDRSSATGLDLNVGGRD